MLDKSSFNRELLAFLERATTPFHAVEAMSATLLAAGFLHLEEGQAWETEPGCGYFLTRNDSSIIAFVHGEQGPPAAGMRMVGAHTDSPCLMVKPNPEKNKLGYFQLGVEVYGGALLNPWFDRDLSLAGRVSFSDSDGAVRSALIDYRRPIACIPSLAIHLDREVNKKCSINPQTDIVPLLGFQATNDGADFRALLMAQLQQEHPQCDVRQVLDYELCFYDSQAPRWWE